MFIYFYPLFIWRLQQNDCFIAIEFVKCRQWLREKRTEIRPKRLKIKPGRNLKLSYRLLNLSRILGYRLVWSLNQPRIIRMSFAVNAMNVMNFSNGKQVPGTCTGVYQSSNESPAVINLLDGSINCFNYFEIRSNVFGQLALSLA